MSKLLEENEDAARWVAEKMTSLSGKKIFGSLKPSVIWDDVKGADGKQLVPLDPVKLVGSVRENGNPLHLGHDPGRPVGRVLAAEVFTGKDGKKFVAAILGYYKDGTHESFAGFGFDHSIAVIPPERLPSLPDDVWIEFDTDPREVEESSVAEILNDAPLHIKRKPLSHNDADAAHELIKVGLPYLLLVWNPFVTAIASEAGKDTYKALRGWMEKLMRWVAKRRSPILEMISHQDDCQVSFIFRGKDIVKLTAALEQLPNAAGQAAHLIGILRHNNAMAKTLFYEFDLEQMVWLPSYAELLDGRFVTDNRLLVAYEKLPRGLSLGLIGEDE
jgi:hypothetical protein